MMYEIVKLNALNDELYNKYGDRYWVEPSVGSDGIDLLNNDGYYLETFDNEKELRSKYL